MWIGTAQALFLQSIGKGAGDQLFRQGVGAGRPVVSRQSTRNSTMFNAAMRLISTLRSSTADWEIGRR